MRLANSMVTKDGMCGECRRRKWREIWLTSNSSGNTTAFPIENSIQKNIV